MVAPYVVNGTVLMELKPSSILAAAEADVKRWRENVMVDGNEAYAFHRNHVRKAMRKERGDARDIIACAINGIDLGRTSGKRLTRELYRDPLLLEAALDG